VNAILPVPPTDARRREAGIRALDHFLGSGFARIEPSVLQPAAAFLDMSGEEIRGRLYLTSDASGAELCLRPEYTIPVCLAHLASPQSSAEAQYAYLGPVFRARPGQSGEMIQTGLESYGNPEIEAADAEILALALEAAEAAGSGPLKVRIGDARVFDGVLGALGLPDVWLRRLRRGLAQGRPLEAVLNGGGQGANSQSGVLAALERADHAGAKALVEDLLAIAGIAISPAVRPPTVAMPGAERPAKSPIDFSNRRRLARSPESTGNSRRFCAASSRFQAIRTLPRWNCAGWRPTPGSTCARRSIRSTSA